MNGVRRNVYVPKPIADRMKRYPRVNWSEEACRAFEKRMDQIDVINAIKNMGKENLAKEY